MNVREVARYREAARQRPLRPYESLHVSPSHWSDQFVAGIDDRLKRGWRMGAIRNIRVQPPVQWTTSSRSFDSHWHAWLAVDELFHAYSLVPDDRYLQAAWDFAWDWLQTFQTPLLSLPTGVAVRRALKGDGTQAWYDMSVGLRLQRMAYLADCACRDDGRSDQDVALLFQAMDFHHRLLSEDRLFKAHNNHGVFQALAQMAAAVRFPDLPRADRYRTLSEDRLRRCIQEHFFDDGVHKEHSPGYHLTLLDTLMSAREHGLLDEEETAWLSRAEDALGWMITPTATLAPFGDTDPLPSSLPNGYVDRFSDESIRNLLRQRRSLQSGVRAYPQSGYVFARQPTGTGMDYFAQQNGFHSRTHKHADSMSFVWSARDREMLADPGRFAYVGKTTSGSDLWNQGFWYDDPRRIYVERTYAHNAISIDGRDHPRMGVAPFGSALLGVELSDGLMVCESEFEIEPGVAWRRVIVRRPGSFLVVVDRVVATKPHDIRQNFTLGSSWERFDAGRYKSQIPKPLYLSILNLGDGVELEQEVRGQTTPELRGWVAKNAQTLIPAPSLAFGKPQSQQALFVTLFVVGTATPGPDAHTLEAATLEGEISWRQGSVTVSLILARDAAGRLIAR